MENARNTEANTTPAQSCCAPSAKSGGLSSRGLLIGVAVLGGGAMFLGWDWLVAAGVATFIVALAPCLVMCALGLCASRMGKKDAGPGAQTIAPREAQLPPAEAVASPQPAAQAVANAEPVAETVTNMQPKAVERAESA